MTLAYGRYLRAEHHLVQICSPREKFRDMQGCNKLEPAYHALPENYQTLATQRPPKSETQPRSFCGACTSLARGLSLTCAGRCPPKRLAELVHGIGIHAGSGFKNLPKHSCWGLTNQTAVAPEQRLVQEPTRATGNPRFFIVGQHLAEKT